MNKGGSQKVGPFTVTMTHAIHSCGILDHGQIIYGGEAAGYVLRFADNRALYFSGDTNVFTDMQLIEQLYHPELAFLPIGDLYTMSPREAAVACRMLKANKVIPMHFGTFPQLTGTPQQLARLIQDLPGTQVWPSSLASRWSGKRRPGPFALSYGSALLTFGIPRVSSPLVN
jgi:L-ascorbate metabolism protein UlaG (beta-lactamase superfamily)